jgi:hypothetical protein
MSDLKVLRASVKNFQCLEEKEIVLNGQSILVIAKNGGGKSTLIRAIKSAGNANILPAKSIKEGEEYAKIEIEVGNDDKKYTFETFFSPENQKGKVVVTDEEGTRITGKSAQQSILGSFTFDPFQFIKLGQTSTGKPSKEGVREQINILKEFLTDEERTELAQLDVDYIENYDERTMVNRELKSLEVEADGSDIPQEDILKYENHKKDRESELIASLEKASSTSADYARVEMGRKNAVTEVEVLKAKIIELESKIKEADAYLKKTKKIDVEAINKELTEVREFNKMHDSIQYKISLTKKIRDKRKETEELTNKLTEIKAGKKSIVENSNLPIKDLTFGDDEILYRELPLNEDHHPKSLIIAIGVQIAMAKNPNLKCIFIDDASLLDDKTLKWLYKKCDESGYQIIAEMVDRNSDELHIEFMEKVLK